MSLTGSKTGGKAILRLTGRSERKMEIINMGYKPHLANPRKVKVIAESKLKSDKADSEALARLLLMNWLPEAYVPDEHIQKFRELTRTRRSFKSMEMKCKNSIHAELIRNRIVI